MAIFVGILLYAGFNVWVFRYSKSSKAPLLKGDSLPKQGVTFTDFGSNLGAPPAKSSEAGSGFAGQDLAPPDTPTPTPRPTGPGEYACDPYGVCNRYGDAARKEFCLVTFADSLCLDQCGDKSKQCKK